MNGILNILKPPGMTSFDVVGYLRGVLKIKKIGHTGTLDPDAVGVLPVCIGNATRAIEYVTDHDKFYRAEMTLGIETDTQDASGNILSQNEIRANADDIAASIISFLGKYSQIPPMYSAVRIGGRKLYELAREGRTVEREPRNVEIFRLAILKITGPEGWGNLHKAAAALPGSVKVLYDISCSKGTYIRTLCHDIGQQLGCGAHMSFLERLKVGSFSIDQAITLEEVDQYARDGLLNSRMITVDKVFTGLSDIYLEETEVRKFLNGVHVPLNKILQPGDLVKVYDTRSCFLALGEIVTKDGQAALKSKKLFL